MFKRRYTLLVIGRVTSSLTTGPLGLTGAKEGCPSLICPLSSFTARGIQPATLACALTQDQAHSLFGVGGGAPTN